MRSPRFNIGRSMRSSNIELQADLLQITAPTITPALHLSGSDFCPLNQPSCVKIDTLLGVTDPGMCLLAQEGLESESC